MATQSQVNVEQEEAKEYWGYLFKPDKTGSDKLKNLLRGLHRIIDVTAVVRPDGRTVLTRNLGHGIRAF